MNRRAWVVTVVPILAIVYIAAQLRPKYFGLMEIAGSILAVVGLTLLTIARVQLGNSFSITPQAKHLVTTGLYSRFRNPIYVFSTIGLAGFVLYLHRPGLLLLLLAIVPVQVMRAKAEERVLTERFGDEYVRYKEHTWF